MLISVLFFLFVQKWCSSQDRAIYEKRLRRLNTIISSWMVYTIHRWMLKMSIMCFVQHPLFNYYIFISNKYMEGCFVFNRTLSNSLSLITVFFYSSIILKFLPEYRSLKQVMLPLYINWKIINFTFHWKTSILKSFINTNVNNICCYCTSWCTGWHSVQLIPVFWSKKIGVL